MNIKLLKKLLLNNTFLDYLSGDYEQFCYFSETGIPDKHELALFVDKLEQNEAYDSLIGLANHRNGFTMQTTQGNVRYYEQ